MARLDWLTIRGFKSIRSLEDFEPRGLNVLIGPNGAGKSNFISLFHMLADMVEERLRLFVAQQDGPDALLFGGRKQTGRIEGKFTFGDFGYHFYLAPAGNSLAFEQEITVFFGDSTTYTRSLGNGHNESRLKASEAEDIENFASYVRSAIAKWRVYHFHDTSETAQVRQASAVRDNLFLKPDARNLAAFLRRLCEHYPDSYRQIVEAVRLAAPFFGDFIYRKDENEKMELEWFEVNDPDTVRGPAPTFGRHATLHLPCDATPSASGISAGFDPY